MTKRTKALAILEDEVADILTSDQWKAALDFRKRLYPYSFGNLMLIVHQFPEATMVAGFWRWKELGRKVKKGEHGIAIIAPLTRKRTNDDGDEEVHVFGVKTAYLFDVSQTEGEPVPEPQRPEILSGYADRGVAIRDALTIYAEARGLTVTTSDPSEDAKGWFRKDTMTVAYRDDLPPLQQAKTLAHEVVHAKLHADSDTERDMGELEAETAAYLVLDGLGLDTSAYSFPYLAGWASRAGKDDKEDAMKKLMAAGQHAATVADEILRGLDGLPRLESAA